MRAALNGVLAAARQAVGGVAADWFTVSERTGGGDVNSTGWGGYTFRMVVPESAIAKNGSKFRFTFYPAGALDFTLAAAYVGEGAESGAAYAFASAPTQILWGGLGSITVTPFNEYLSDEMEIAVDGSKNLVLALYFTGSAVLRSDAPAADVGQTYHYKFGNDAATEAASGYTITNDGSYSFKKLELFG